MLPCLLRPVLVNVRAGELRAGAVCHRTMVRETGSPRMLKPGRMERFRLDIPFNRPHATGRESQYIAEAIAGLQLSGNGPFGRRCEDWLRQHHDVELVF